MAPLHQSELTKVQISQKCKEYWDGELSEKHREVMRSKASHPMKQETKQKLSIALKKHWDKLRAEEAVRLLREKELAEEYNEEE